MVQKEIDGQYIKLDSRVVEQDPASAFLVSGYGNYRAAMLYKKELQQEQQQGDDAVSSRAFASCVIFINGGTEPCNDVVR